MTVDDPSPSDGDAIPRLLRPISDQRQPAVSDHERRDTDGCADLIADCFASLNEVIPTGLGQHLGKVGKDGL